MHDNTQQTEVHPSSKQDGISRDDKGRILPGSRLNPNGAGGFTDNPQNRANGNWKKEDTARHKLEQMMQLTELELTGIASNPASPVFEQKLAKAIIDCTWTTIKEMMDQVYGRKSDVDMSMKMDEGVPIIRGFVIPTAPEDFIDDDGNQNPKYG